jgi:hypothetical protein
VAQTDRLALPLLAAGQAQKELTHNEALGLIDITVQLVAESADLVTPPGAPEAGQCWIVATGAGGAWSGKAGQVACWTENGWLFAQAKHGWAAWVVDRQHSLRFDDPDWADEPARNDGFYVAGDRVVGIRQPAISEPSGGAVQDVEARAILDAMLAALRAHGLIDT